MRLVLIMALAFGSGMLAATPGRARGPDCDRLVGTSLGQHGSVESAVTIEWGSADRSAYCEVKGTLHPAPGSDIGVVYRLPVKWNGKLLGLGGGGWAGNVRRDAAAPGLARGYAIAQTDAGHSGTSTLDTQWAGNPEAVKDFSYRAVHEMTLAAKQLLLRYYARAPRRTYYQGCSTGGRMGLVEAQRFPTDYDGIIAGAPVYTLQVQTSARLRNQTLNAPGVGLTAADLALVNAAVIKACGNGRDPYLVDPRKCRWDPVAIQCRPGQTGGGCLRQLQVDALRVAYAGIRARDGSFASLPLERGGEHGWSRAAWGNFLTAAGDPNDVRGLQGLRALLFDDSGVDVTNLRVEDVAIARSSAFAKMYEAADPDISAFVNRGGRLILWHGLNDASPSPEGTIDYYQAILREHPQSGRGVRLFLAPGVEHCGGGPGPDRIDTIDALERWVEHDRPPARLLASTNDASSSRPLCPYPMQAVYDGPGDLNDPKHYRCR